MTRLRHILRAKLQLRRHLYPIHRWLPLIVLLGGLSVTYLLWQHETNVAEQQLKTTFDFRVRETISLLEQRMQVYQQALSGIQSLYAASRKVDRTEFMDFTRKLLSEKDHAGIKALGYVALVKPADKSRHITEMQQEGIGAYRIHPELVRDYHTPVVYIAPHSEENHKVLGFDTASVVARREAQEKARDENDIAISRKILLLEGTNQGLSPPGFVMFLPIYRNGVAHETLQARRQTITGWAYAAFAAEDFLQELFGHYAPDLDIKIYDGNTLSIDNLLFERKDIKRANEHSTALFRHIVHTRILNHDWTLVASSLPAFEATLDFGKAALVAQMGGVLSLLISSLVWLLIDRTQTLRAIQRVNQELMLSEQRWKFALEGAGDGVWEWDLASGSVLYSRRWSEMLGFVPEEISAKIDAWRNRIHPDDIMGVLNNLDSYLTGKKSNYFNELRMRCKDGSWKWILARGMIVERDPSGGPKRMIGTHTDISQIKESEEIIWRQAHFDPLTGLINRRMFYERLELEIRKSSRSGLAFALIFLDLDRFKEVNDTLGHDNGDALLKDVAQRLLDCVRETDVVARLGGDEFILILPDLQDIRIIERIATNILEVIAQPFELESERAYVSASLGITFYPADATNIETLMKNVDQAMYAAKGLGRNRFAYFTAAMQEAAIKRMLLAKELREALGRGQFQLLYQPIINLQSGAINKAEALIRWDHPQHGVISPADFIPIAEDNGTIVEIGDWVFHQAADQVKQWRDTMLEDFQVSINKSPVQFNNGKSSHLPWLAYLSQIGLPGHSMVVEITEGLLLDANQNVIRTLYEFRDNGVQVALDDFGTGYSSLAYLRKFDIDYIKIDKVFISNLSSSPDDLALCSAMVEMARKLGLQVIAEGVETEEQCNLLREIGCDYAQGYLFSKPVSSEELTRLMKTNFLEDNAH